MNPTPIAALALVLIALPARAADDPVNGRALFEDTPGTSGLNTLTASCINCHGSVENRRASIGGSPFADISFDTAMGRFVAAANGQPEMRQFLALSQQQARDIGAYIADTPKTSATTLDFLTGPTVPPAAAQPIDLTSAVATTESLKVEAVAITGSGAARFTRSADACNLQTLAPGASCRVSVGLAATGSVSADATLVFTLRQGTSPTTFTRSVALRSSIFDDMPVVVDDSAKPGGGAFGFGWLVALGLAVLGLRRTSARVSRA